jgi:hypothetical protein
MNFEEGKSSYPIDRRKILEKNKEVLSAVEVKNHVVYVNPDIDSPFDLQQGKSTRLGIFLSSEQHDGDKARAVEVEVEHGRSALLIRAIFGEKKKGEGPRQMFRDVDIKGGGWVIYRSIHGEIVPQVGEIMLEGNDKGTKGILNMSEARQNAHMSEMFQKLGIRTNRTVAIIALEELVYKGEKISIEEARSKGLIAESMQPVLEVRAFGTHARLIDATSLRSSDIKKTAYVEDARLLVAQELGEDPAQFDMLRYAEWLAQTVGKNIGLMHKNRHVHKMLGLGHNITLDGCVVDFAAVEKIGNEEKYKLEEDYVQGKEALEKLFRSIVGLPETPRLLDAYANSYDNVCPET